MRATSSWSVERVCGGAGALHARGVPATPTLRRSVEVLVADRPALVLGSTQPAELVDDVRAAAAGVDVARRRSGGGVVFVDPASMLWVDVLLPAGDELWSDDVHRAAGWVGEAWASALGLLGAVADPAVHDGAMCHNRWGRLVCFAGLGPGEVTDGPGGPKVVGVSQRRTRFGARFQCAVPFAWEPQRFVPLLRVDEPDAVLADLLAPGVVRPLRREDRDDLLEAFLAALPD